MGGPPRPRNDPRKEIAANHVARLAIGATESLSHIFRLNQVHVNVDVVPGVRSERPVLAPDYPSDAPATVAQTDVDPTLESRAL
jgi:hypothetical protein